MVSRTSGSTSYLQIAITITPSIIDKLRSIRNYELFLSEKFVTRWVRNPVFLVSIASVEIINSIYIYFRTVRNNTNCQEVWLSSEGRIRLQQDIFISLSILSLVSIDARMIHFLSICLQTSKRYIDAVIKTIELVCIYTVWQSTSENVEETRFTLPRYCQERSNSKYIIIKSLKGKFQNMGFKRVR